MFNYNMGDIKRKKKEWFLKVSYKKIVSEKGIFLTFFIDDLSLWYVRRSRDRFRREEENNKEAIEVFYRLLLDLLKITGLITPFFSEEMYQRLRSDDMSESIHLFNWPKADKKLIDAELEKKMPERTNPETSRVNPDSSITSGRR